MSYEDGWAAINLEMPKRVPRTEYSVERHWDLIKVVTGMGPTKPLPIVINFIINGIIYPCVYTSAAPLNAINVDKVAIMGGICKNETIAPFRKPKAHPMRRTRGTAK